MSRITRRSILRAGGIAGVTALAGCTDNGGGGNGGGGNGGSLSLKIGHMNPLSGSNATVGRPQKRGVDLAAEVINGMDDDFEVDIVHADDESSTDVAVQEARRLSSSEGVDAILGFSISSVALAVSEFAANENLVINATTPQTEKLTGEECRKTTFRTGSNLLQRNTALPILIGNETDVGSGTRIAGINPDYVFGHSSWKKFNSEMDNRFDGLKWVHETFPSLGKGDFQNEIQAIDRSNPDIIYSSLVGGDLIVFLKQAGQYGLFDDAQLVDASGSIFTSTRELNKNNREPLRGALTETHYFFTNPDTDRNRQFVENFRNKYDRTPVPAAQEAYGGLFAYYRAAKKSGGTSTDDLINGLEGLEFETPEGTKKIRESDHQAQQPKMWTGTVGPVKGIDYYGMSNVIPVDGKTAINKPNCSM